MQTRHYLTSISWFTSATKTNNCHHTVYKQLPSVTHSLTSFALPTELPFFQDIWLQNRLPYWLPETSKATFCVLLLHSGLVGFLCIGENPIHILDSQLRTITAGKGL